ncbi:hypothetical protein WV31_19230 [Magnetospirillum sp. ME-1]|uniref:hypothetical protein n=1 Tax=Magnetospirillum sp. ME-1 TaxID=1639348 RepID=UPI000A17FC64|nr:hypothetical protein [Magnetospirillum sp. ME-1]ARJ67635.1 hypothetical protein WV31_19230 [Magnetospirillum sp. ME-1]
MADIPRPSSAASAVAALALLTALDVWTARTESVVPASPVAIASEVLIAPASIADGMASFSLVSTAIAAPAIIPAPAPQEPLPVAAPAPAPTRMETPAETPYVAAPAVPEDPKAAAKRKREEERAAAKQKAEEERAAAKKKAEEERAEARRQAQEFQRMSPKERAARLEAKAEEDFFRCRTPMETVPYTGARIPSGEYRKATTANPFCVLSRAAPVERVADEALIAAEREWLDAWRANPTGKHPKEPVVHWIPDGLTGGMQRAWIRLQAMDQRPAGWDATVAEAKAKLAAGDREGAVRTASSYINSAGKYCIHDPGLKADCSPLKSVPKAWLSEYTPGPVALFERGGGDCRDYSVARWLMWKLIGIPDEDNAIMEGGHGRGQHDNIVHVWSVVRVDGRVLAADYPTTYLDRALVPLRKADWLSGIGAWDTATDQGYAG